MLADALAVLLLVHRDLTVFEVAAVVLGLAVAIVPHWRKRRRQAAR